MRRTAWILSLGLFLLPGCASTRPGAGQGKPEVGIASYYAPKFHGRKTASGETYDASELTAAHPRHPFGTRVRVTNLANGRKIVLTITDRGPFVKGRVIDVSRSAARYLGFWRKGTARVRVEVVDSGSAAGF